MDRTEESPERDHTNTAEGFLTKVQSQSSGERMVFSTMLEKHETLTHTLYNNEFKMDHRLTCKT